MNKNNLKKILKSRLNWHLAYKNGRRANLRRADLCEADLSGVDLSRADLFRANLRGADLNGANLSGVDLSRADLCEADLSGVDLSGADLFRANLCGADLSGANLCGADLNGATLREANLSRADLSGANLYGADLSEVDLRGANLSRADLSRADLCEADLSEAKNIPFIPSIVPEKGSFIGWKKANGYIIKLLIPDSAKRVSGTSRKCRCDKAKVLAIETYGGKLAKIKKIASDFDVRFVYAVGKTVKVDNFENNRFITCAPGIHFFINRQEAVEY